MAPASRFDWHIENAVCVVIKVTGHAEVSQLVWLPSWVSWDVAEDDTLNLNDSHTDGVLADMIEAELSDYDSDAEYGPESQGDKIGSHRDIEMRQNFVRTSEELQMSLRWERPVSRHICLSQILTKPIL